MSGGRRMATTCQPIHRIEYHDAGPDDHGRRRFTVFWMADYHPGDPRGEYRTAERGQEYWSDRWPLFEQKIAQGLQGTRP